MALELRNGQSPPLRDGHPRSVTAIGVYAPFRAVDYHARRNLTQPVVYHSRDPEIALPTKEDGNRSRIVGVAPGCARIYADDPATGIESPDHVLCNLGRLTGLVADDREYQSRVVVGRRFGLKVWGVHEGGWFRLDRVEPETLASETTDASVVGIADDGLTLVAVAPGRATVHAQTSSQDRTAALIVEP